MRPTPTAATTDRSLSAPPSGVPADSHWNSLPNLLERDGTAVLAEQFLPREEADGLFDEFTAMLSWERATVTVRGKEHLVPRCTAWFGAVPYRYSGLVHPAAPWPACLEGPRRLVTDALGVEFNTVLANRYKTGRDRVAYHADDEERFGEDPTIASLSLGGTRRFLMRHRSGSETVGVDLTHSSLLVMAGSMQRHWRHAVPSTTREVSPRINLTFRHVAMAGRELDGGDGASVR